MAPASNEEQFKFLISCIRYSNNGKVDFGQVAKECKIVSKGAAAKRYERMMRSHGIPPNAATIKPAPSRTLKSDRNESVPSSSTPSTTKTKKRKTESFLDENIATDDDEGFGTIKPDPVVDIKEQFVVKEEEVHPQRPPGQLSLRDAANLMQYYDTPTQYAGGLGLEDYSEGYTAAQNYGTGVGGSSISGSAMGAPYGLDSQQTYNFPSQSSYGSIGMGSGLGGMHISESPRAPYLPLMQYSSDDQDRGRSDSPVIVE